MKLLSDYRTEILLPLVIIFFILLNSGSIGESALTYVDAPRHAMDGIYFHDLFLGILKGDIPVDYQSIYGFTMEYFFRYPSLGLVWWPPFFPVVMSLFYFLFGVSVFSAKLTIFCFGILGLVYWYKMILMQFENHGFKDALAFLSSLFFILSPFVIEYSRNVMRELPATALAIASFFYFLSWVRFPEKKKHIILAGIFAAFAVLTKTEMVFLIFVFFSYVLLKKKVKRVLDKEVFISAAIFLVLVVPWILFSIKMFPERVGEGFGELGNSSILSLGNWLYYLEFLPSHLGIIFLSLAVLGMLYSLVYFRENKETMFSFVFIAVAYLFFSLISEKQLRCGFYYLPFFSFFASYVIIKPKIFHRKILRIPLALLLSFIVFVASLVMALGIEEKDFHAYATAAEYVMERQVPGSTIFFLGKENGNFVYNVRLLDEERSAVVLRGSIFLTSFRIHGDWGSQDYISSEEGIYGFFDEMGVLYVVVEEPYAFLDENGDPYPVFSLLQERMLAGPDFKKEWSEYSPAVEKNITIYKYKRFKPISKDTIEMPFYAIGKNVSITLKKTD